MNRTNLFDEVLSGNLYRHFRDDAQTANRQTLRPRVNIQETEDAFEMEFVVPGIAKEEIKINIEDKNLNVSYDHPATTEAKGKSLRTEYKMESFSRNFSIGESINIDDISAKFENGILYLSLPKKEEVKPTKRRIEVA